MLGCYKGNREKYDLIDIIFIGLGNFEDKNDETIVGFLDNILDRDLEPLKRKQILKDKYYITTSDDLMEVFGDMCNLSDGVYLDGVRKGNTLENALDIFDITDKDEIESLKKLVVN